VAVVYTEIKERKEMPDRNQVAKFFGAWFGSSLFSSFGSYLAHCLEARYFQVLDRI